MRECGTNRGREREKQKRPPSFRLVFHIYSSEGRFYLASSPNLFTGTKKLLKISNVKEYDIQFCRFQIVELDE